jgi:phosphohistidine phosphatase
MELLLIRHAIAEPRDARRWPEDRERPLSRLGQQRATHAARGLRRLKVKPALLLCSPFKRTRQTAAILSMAAHWPRPQACEQLSPGKSPALLLTHLATFDVARLALIGHEPELGQLLELCLGSGHPGARIEVKKLAALCLQFERRPLAGSARLRWFLPPRLLRAMR